MKIKMNIQEKRLYLKELSKGLSVLKKLGAIDSVNEGLKSVYAQQGHTELKSIQQWNREGKRVKKGETALLLWACPKKKNSLNPSSQNKPTENESTEATGNLNFFPLCYVFSNLQIMEAN
jgi:hypothetical protein